VHDASTFFWCFNFYFEDDRLRRRFLGQGCYLARWVCMLATWGVSSLNRTDATRAWPLPRAHAHVLYDILSCVRSDY